MAKKKEKDQPVTSATSVSVGKDMFGNIVSGDNATVSNTTIIQQMPSDPRLRAVPPAPPPYFTGREAERKRRGRYLDEMGDTRSARRLLGLHATGMP